MKIHEYQAKEIFAKYGIPVPAGGAAFSPEEAESIFRKNNFAAAMVKAQVLAGGRGKAGGVLKAASAAEAAEAAQKLLGQTLATAQSGGRTPPIRTVLVEERQSFTQELYLGLAVDRSRALPALIFSESGGMDIEEISRTAPSRIQKHPFDPDAAADPSAFRGVFALSPALEPHRDRLARIAFAVTRIFREWDAQLVEINPLAAEGERLLALDAKINFDDNAVYRHPELEKLKDPDEETSDEKRAKQAGLSYVSLDGNIGCLVNGAGLAMATMDVTKQVGGEPANFLDVGGGADKTRVLEAFRILLEDRRVRAVFVNIFGGITQCDVIAQALVEAASEIDIRVSVVVRLEGTRVEEGRTILKQAKAKLHTAATMEEGAKLAVELASRAPVTRSVR